MKPMDRPQFILMLGELSAAFRVDPTTEQAETYWKYLQDRSLYQVSSAIVDIIQTGDRFPTVAQIRTLAGTYREMKTVEVPSGCLMLEQFAGSDLEKYKGMTGDEFFKTVMSGMPCV
jgi:hypothetical protein